MKRLVSLPVLALFSLLYCGCSGTDPAGIAVSGMVEFQGKPLDHGTIDFAPTSEQGTFSGASITDGHYEIPAENGLKPGNYDVRISSSEGGAVAEGPPGDSTITAKERIPAKFNTATTLKAEVKDDGQQTFDFKIP
jgi:hypothetical protein